MIVNSNYFLYIDDLNLYRFYFGNIWTIAKRISSCDNTKTNYPKCGKFRSCIELDENNKIICRYIFIKKCFDIFGNATKAKCIMQ